MPYPPGVHHGMFTPAPPLPACVSCDEPCEHAECCACGCGVSVCEHCRVRCANCDDYYALGCTELAPWHEPVGEIPVPRECHACAMAARNEVVSNLLQGLEQLCDAN